MALSSRNKANKSTTKAAPKANAKVTPKEEETQAPVDQEEVVFPTKEQIAEDLGLKEKEEVQDKNPEVEQPASTKKDLTVSSGNSLAASPGKVQVALMEFKNAIAPVEFGTLPRIKPVQGQFLCDEETLGTRFTASVVSYNDAFTIAPNKKDASPKLCRYSYDNQVLNDGSGDSVQDYITYLKEEEDCPDANSKRYVELICILEDAEQDHDEIGGMVMISLSPMSVKQFERYQLQTTVKITRGQMTQEQAMNIEVSAKIQTYGQNTFTMARFKTAE